MSAIAAVVRDTIVSDPYTASQRPARAPVRKPEATGGTAGPSPRSARPQRISRSRADRRLAARIVRRRPSDGRLVAVSTTRSASPCGEVAFANVIVDRERFDGTLRFCRDCRNKPDLPTKRRFCDLCGRDGSRRAALFDGPVCRPCARRVPTRIARSGPARCRATTIPRCRVSDGVASSVRRVPARRGTMRGGMLRERCASHRDRMASVCRRTPPRCDATGTPVDPSARSRSPGAACRTPPGRAGRTRGASGHRRPVRPRRAALDLARIVAACDRRGSPRARVVADPCRAICNLLCERSRRGRDVENHRPPRAQRTCPRAASPGLRRDHGRPRRTGYARTRGRLSDGASSGERSDGSGLPRGLIGEGKSKGASPSGEAALDRSGIVDRSLGGELQPCVDSRRRLSQGSRSFSSHRLR